MSTLRASLVPSILFAGLLLSCTSPEGPYVRIIEPLDLPEQPRIYVVSNRDPQRVVESFESNGLIMGGFQKSNLLVRVNFGRDRRQTYECGQIRNLRYGVYLEKRLVISMRGRGPTGHCGENIVDRTSAELARLLGN